MKSYDNVDNKLVITDTTEVVTRATLSLEQLNAKLQAEKDRKDFDNSVRDAQIAEIEDLIETAQNLGVTEQEVSEE